MPLPTLTPEQRTQALEAARTARRARAEVKDKLKHGTLTLADVIRDAASNPALAKTKVITLLEALPGYGKVRAKQLMERLRIAENRTIRGLSDKQREALLKEFPPAAA